MLCSATWVLRWTCRGIFAIGANAAYIFTGRFRGSIYKLVWKEVVGFLLLFFTLPLIYDYLLDAQQQK